MIDSNSHTHGKSWRKHTHSWPPNQQKQRDTHKKPEAPPLFNLRMHTCWLEHTAAQQPHLWPVLLDCPWPWSLPGGSAAATSTGSPCQGTGHSSPPPHLRMPSPIALSPASISFSVVIYKWTSSRSRSDASYPQWHPPTPPLHYTWFRHVTHHNSLSNTIPQGTLDGGWCHGWQRKCWMVNIKAWTSLPMQEMFTRASCRKDGKRISAELSLMSPSSSTPHPPKTQSVKGLNWTIHNGEHARSMYYQHWPPHYTINSLNAVGEKSFKL